MICLSLSCFTLHIFYWCNVIFLQQSNSLWFWMPFPVSPVCPWLVFWCLKWLWSLTLPGFPGTFETLHVEIDKGCCDFPVSYFLFPLKTFWLLWAQSSAAGWDGLRFQHLLGNWGQPKNFDIRKLFILQIFSCTQISTIEQKTVLNTLS